MVFPSLPVYLDPPNNWSQQQTNQQAGVGIQNPVPSPPQPPPPSTACARGGGHQQQGCSIRAGSMADRARLAKVSQPEAALKCPRCESTNTKFCYYNNYSLSQPRHFCKTCRRYWTRGGALRSVPVGGGCRRNKRSKGGSSRSKSDSPMIKAARSSSATANSSSTASDVIIGRHLPTQLPLLGNNVHHCNNYVSGGIGVHFSAAGTSSDAEFQIGNNGSSMLSNGLNEQWRLPNLQQVHHHQQHQQFPLFTNLEQPPFGLFQFDNGENNNGEQPQSYMGGYGSRLRSNKTLDAGVSGIMPQLTAVKMEENQGLSLSNSILGSSANHQFWGAANGNNNAWNDIPGFSSSTSNHLL